MSLIANSSSSARKASGSHYTPDELARFVADQIVDRMTIKNPRVLDPACGEGALLAAFQARLPEASLYGYDLNPLALEKRPCRSPGSLRKPISYMS